MPSDTLSHRSLLPRRSPVRTDTEVPEAELRARHFLAPLAVGIFALCIMLAVAALEGLPVRDPDARYVGSPLALIGLICALFVLLDVLPRAIRRARFSDLTAVEAVRILFAERWWGRRGLIVLVCILGFYATYLSYRNLKSFLPFVTDGVLHDSGLLALDADMFFGSQPATLLHDALGTNFAATVLSAVYLAFLTFVPLSLGVALVWSSRVTAGLWYVTALTLDWMIGTLSYYLLPSMGPIYARPGLFADLPSTGVSELQTTLLDHRREVLANPETTNAVQSIAGFASLHVAVILTAAMIAQFVGAPRLLRVGLWIFFGLTVVSTIYFGWHYVIDDVAGVAIAVVAVYAGAFLVGLRPPPFGASADLRERSNWLPSARA
jgi:hypothetical protein